jgi:hypothetical protein
MNRCAGSFESYQNCAKVINILVNKSGSSDNSSGEKTILCTRNQEVRQARLLARMSLERGTSRV